MNRRMTALLALVLLSALFCTAVRADFGPKDKLTIYVKNPPGELYYLDLLYENDPEKEVYTNLSTEELETLNSAMLARIRDDISGLTAALTEGTQIPTYGSLIGEADGLRMKHSFSYYGLPQTYRIIIVTESGAVHVSGEFTRKAMQSSITYDCETGMAEIPPLWKQYALQFLYTLAMTVLLEGGLFLLFRFSLREDGVRFFFVNLVTQIALTAIVGSALIFQGPVGSFLVLGFCELATVTAEAAAFAFLLRGHTKKRRIVYGITANLVSWLVSALALDVIYTRIVSIA